MPEGLRGPWPEQLELLLERLRKDGFRVGVAETLRVHQLLVALVERGVLLESPERLARLLGPVLCRSAREQETIRRHLADWWPGPVVVEVAKPPEEGQALGAAPSAPLPGTGVSLSGPAAELEAALRGVGRHRQGLLRWLPTTPLALGLTAAVAVAGLSGMVELRKRLSQEPPPVAQQGPSPIKPLPTPAPQPQPAPTPSAPARNPAAPEPEPALARDDGLFLLPSELALLLGVGLLASLLGVQGAVRGWWWREARLLLERLQLEGNPELHRLSLGELERQLVALPDAHRIGRALNVWQRLPSEELDCAATVEASLEAGGWLSPRYGQRRQRQSYLFLLEQESLADQQTRHLRAWLEGLRHEGVLAEWVCFQREPLFCQGPEGHGPRRRLAELAALHPEALVVVVADGERLFSPVDGAPRPWLRQLAAWPRQMVLTPRPCERWGSLEAELAQHLPVLPATPEGLLQLGGWLREEPSLTAAIVPGAAPSVEPAGTAEPPEPPLLQGSATPWLERTPPAPAVVRELLAQLRAFLGPEGFYWLAACAVFPELHWTITVHLGQRLRDAEDQPLPRHCPLPRLTRLPWLRHGYLPDWLRLVLIQTLTPAQEAAVREELTILLLAAVPLATEQQPGEGSAVGDAELGVATERVQRLPRLFPTLLERLRRRANPTSPLRDQLFLRFLQQRPLLAADAPESLRSLLARPEASQAEKDSVLQLLTGTCLSRVLNHHRRFTDAVNSAPASPVEGVAKSRLHFRRQTSLTAAALFGLSVIGGLAAFRANLFCSPFGFCSPSWLKRAETVLGKANQASASLTQANNLTSFEAGLDELELQIKQALDIEIGLGRAKRQSIGKLQEQAKLGRARLAKELGYQQTLRQVESELLSNGRLDPAAAKQGRLALLRQLDAIPTDSFAGVEAEQLRNRINQAPSSQLPQPPHSVPLAPRSAPVGRDRPTEPAQRLQPSAPRSDRRSPSRVVSPPPEAAPPKGPRSSPSGIGIDRFRRPASPLPEATPPIVSPQPEANPPILSPQPDAQLPSVSPAPSEAFPSDAPETKSPRSKKS